MPEEPSRFERQTNMLRGKFSGASTSSQAKERSPFFSDWATKAGASIPAAVAFAAMVSGFCFSVG